MSSLHPIREQTNLPATTSVGDVREPMVLAVDDTDINLRELARKIRHRWPYLAVSFLACILIGFVYLRRTTPIYEADSTVKIDTSKKQDGAPQSGLDVMQQMFGGDDTTVDTQVEVIKSNTLRERAANTMQSLDPKSFSKEALKRATISVDRVKTADVVDIRVDHPSPLVAETYANAIASAYVNQTMIDNQLHASGASGFLQKQLTVMGAELRRKMRDLAEAQRRLHITDVPSNLKASVDATSSLEANLLDADAMYAGEVRLLEGIRRQLSNTPKQIIGSVVTGDNPQVEETRGLIATLEGQKALALKEFQPDQPEVTSLQTQIDTLRSEVRTEFHNKVESSRQANPVWLGLLQQFADAQSQVMSLRAKRDQMERNLRLAQNASSTLPEKAKILGELQLDVDSLSKTFQLLNDSYQQMLITEKAQLPDASVIDRATLPVEPVRPRHAVVLFMSGLTGLMLGFMLIGLIEGLDNTIHNTREVEEKLGTSVLTMVPRLKSAPDGGTKGELGSSGYVGYTGYGGYHTNSASTFNESVRLLRTSIAFANPDIDIQTLMVTSALPGEGKTTIAIQLARSMAQSERRVILVDTDLRRPAVSRQFDAQQKPGLTNVVMGQTSLEAALLTTDEERLRVLPSGPLPSNPSEFLDSRRFSEVVEELKGMADVIVFDTPPSMVMTDGLVLARQVDGVVVVMIPGTTPQPAISRTLEMLRRVHANILGMCLNKVSRSGTGYYGYDYGYYYSHYYSAYNQSANGNSSSSNGRQNGSTPGRNGSGHLPKLRQGRSDTDHTEGDSNGSGGPSARRGD